MAVIRPRRPTVGRQTIRRSCWMFRKIRRCRARRAMTRRRTRRCCSRTRRLPATPYPTMPKPSRLRRWPRHRSMRVLRHSTTGAGKRTHYSTKPSLPRRAVTRCWHACTSSRPSKQIPIIRSAGSGSPGSPIRRPPLSRRWSKHGLTSRIRHCSNTVWLGREACRRSSLTCRTSSNGPKIVTAKYRPRSA